MNKEQKISNNRQIFYEDWRELRDIETDRQKKLPRPVMFKQAKEGSSIINCVKSFPNIKQKTLSECIQNRRSLRKYNNTPLTFEEVSYLLWETSRVVDFKPGVTFRTIPTGGATNSMETYIYFNNVEGYVKGLYHYIQDKHQLTLLDDSSTIETRVNDSLNHQLRGASVVLFFSAVPYRSEYKYAYFAHKMIAIEAGHACQNLSLAAEVVDSGAVALCAYVQESVDELLQLDGKEEFVTYAVPVGKK